MATALDVDDRIWLTRSYGPSQLEQRVARVLDRVGARYRTQAPFYPYAVDFLISWDTAGSKRHYLALEVDGCTVHGCATCGYDHVMRDKRAQDSRRDFALLWRYGLRLVHVWGHDLRTDKQALATITRLLTARGYPTDQKEAAV